MCLWPIRFLMTWELVLEVEGLRVCQRNLGVRFLIDVDFLDQRPVQLGQMFQLGLLPPGKFLAATRIFCVCGTFSFSGQLG